MIAMTAKPDKNERNNYSQKKALCVFVAL